MTVGAVGRSFGISYPVHNISGVSPAGKAELRKQEDENTSPALKQGEVSQAEPERQKLQDIRLDDVMDQFPDDYGYIGRDKEIQNLDVEKAVSDMQKDKVLQQYQFFVDASEADQVLFGSEDGIVIRK